MFFQARDLRRKVVARRRPTDGEVVQPATDDENVGLHVQPSEPTTEGVYVTPGGVYMPFHAIYSLASVCLHGIRSFATT